MSFQGVVLWSFITLDCILLKDNNLALTAKLWPKIISWARLWVLVRPYNTVICWLNSQPLVICVMFCLEFPRVGTVPRNWHAEPSLVSTLVISFPLITECPGAQTSLTEWWVEGFMPNVVDSQMLCEAITTPQPKPPMPPNYLKFLTNHYTYMFSVATVPCFFLKIHHPCCTS